MTKINNSSNNNTLAQWSKTKYAFALSAIITLLSACWVNTKSKVGQTKEIHENFESSFTDRKEKNKINRDGDNRIIGKKWDTTITYTANSHEYYKWRDLHSTASYLESIWLMTENDKGTISYDWKYEITETKDNGKLIAKSPISRDALDQILTRRLQNSINEETE